MGWYVQARFIHQFSMNDNDPPFSRRPRPSGDYNNDGERSPRPYRDRDTYRSSGQGYGSDRRESSGGFRERRDYRNDGGRGEGQNERGERPRRFEGRDREERNDRFSPRPHAPRRFDMPRKPVWEKEEAPEGSENWLSPWVQLKYFSYNPAVFPRMLGAVSSEAKAGDLVTVYDRNGEIFGAGFWNPRSKTPLRIMHHGKDAITEAMIDAKLAEAVRIRRNFFKLDEVTNAYRLIHGDSDGIGGLIADRFDDVLSLEISTLGAWIRLPRWLPILHELCGTKRHIVSCDENIARMEGINVTDVPSSDPVRLVKIKENDITFEVNFMEGHKTGFFCDQRDNRRRMATLLEGKTFLELCCYTGGFSIAAKILGNAAEVTGVDLDEKAIALAKRNANINQAKVDFVHADAFTYARQMIRNGQMFDTVLLDPPKFVQGREEIDYEEGLKKYHDLNSLGLQCVKPGGLFVTCSCSGLVSPNAFENIVIRAAQRQGRKLRILDITGPGYDHPYLSTYPEGRYLKVLWAIAE